MRFDIRLAFIALLTLAAVAPASAIGLNEVMFDPDGNENTDEFIELYNELPYHVNLSGWLITDGEGIDTLLPLEQGLIVPPYKYVLVLDAEYLPSGSSTYDGLVPDDAIVVTISGSTFGSRGLSNSTPETVSLMDPQGTIVSSYTYSVGNQMGRSDERVLFTGGNDTTNWADALVLHGTPGGRNSVMPPERDLGIVRMFADPSAPQLHDSFSIVIGVRNEGLNALSDSLRLFERWSVENHDSLAEIRSWWLAPLNPGDSISVVSSGIMAAAVPRYFRAQLIGPDDQPGNSVRDLTVSSTGSTGAVVINEIMYAPDVGMSEWFELRNASGFPAYVGQWHFADGSGLVDTTRRVTLPEITLAADSLLVLAADSSIFFEHLPPTAQVVVWNSAFVTLNNNGDSLLLWDETHSLIDRVDYRSSWSSGTGISTERVSAAAGSNDPLNWAASLDSTGGTPGRANTRSLPASARSEQILTLEPNPFSPDNDGRDDLLAICFRLEYADSQIDLKIYDIAGREVRRLANSAPAGYAGEVLWDGTDEHGRKLPTGLYIVYLEALGKGGSRVQTARRVAALARPS